MIQYMKGETPPRTRALTIDFVRKLPLVEQARYADHICCIYGSNKTWRDQQCPPNSEFSIQGMNATSIGNFAFLALHDERFVEPLNKLRALPKIPTNYMFQC